MSRVSRYLLTNFFQTFLSLFFILFFLVTVITFIKISKFTILFSIQFVDLFEMYLYLLPEIITYVLPVTFFISLSISVFKLSRDNEMIVLFAMSLSPKKISRLFFGLSFLVSLVLILNGLFLIPISKQLAENFLTQKKIDAKVNIKESEFGQKFSSWNVFVDRVDNSKKYKNIVLYQNDKNLSKETFIIADSAKIDNNNFKLDLKLNSGYLYLFKKKKIKEIDYSQLKISYKPEIEEVKSSKILDYWGRAKFDKDRAEKLSFTTIIALFPLASYLFAISFGTANLRHETPNIYLNIFIVVLLYYFLTYQMAAKFPFIAIPVILAIFYIGSLILFNKRILKRY